jgi:hypothetical protein
LLKTVISAGVYVLSESLAVPDVPPVEVPAEEHEATSAPRKAPTR